MAVYSSALIQKHHSCMSCSAIPAATHCSAPTIRFNRSESRKRIFFRAVLRHKRSHENPRDFVRNSIELAVKHDLNRYTLYDDLLEAIAAFLDTPDLKEIAIATCDEMWSRTSTHNASPRSASKSYEDRSIEYQRTRVPSEPGSIRLSLSYGSLRVRRSR
jgi:hypothetical protein